VEFEKNTMLFGADPTPRIVAIELGETGTVKVYRREKMDRPWPRSSRFIPSFGPTRTLSILHRSRKLAGDLKYGWRVTVDSWKELIALRNGLKTPGVIFSPSPIRCNIISRDGSHVVQDLPFEELKRMQIEVLSFSDDSDDHLMSIALADNSAGKTC